MRVDVTLPRLVGTRQSADELFGAAVAGKSNVQTIVLRARAVLNAAPSFVDEIVKLAGEKRVAEIHLVGESRELHAQFTEAASRRGGAVKVTSASAALV